MPLSSGSRLGQYEIRAPLGAGGMGEVYRASDLKLGRDVAIKVLPGTFSADPDRLARFEREAKVLASLNHTNIGAIYDLQAEGDTRFLVLELVEGETLDTRLRRGPLSVNEALEIGKQIAAALEAAHQKGVLHRDLKPSNVQLTPEGQVKVLDFGLAKVMAPEATGPSASATILSPAQTRVGVILGTAAYMSPEQARGHELDERTDLWSFGCVLYECLTGKQAFEGDDVTETLAAILKSEPDLSALPPGTPAVVRSLLRQCLRKQRGQRLRDAAAARLMIEDALTAPPELPMAAAKTRAGRWRLALLAGAAFLFVGFALGRLLSSSPAPIAAPVTQVSTDVRPAERLPGRESGRPAFALSPDGRTLVFSGFAEGRLQLYKRSLDAREAVPLAGTRGGALWPFFSPDGKWVAFYSLASLTLRKVPIDGGPAIDIVDLGKDESGQPRLPFGATWAGDTIYYSFEKGGIVAVPAGGGVAVDVVTPPADANEADRLPHVLPGGKAILYTVVDDPADRLDIVGRALPQGTPKVLIAGAADARYIEVADRGYLLYMKTGALMGVRFDAATLEITSAPITLLDDVMQSVAQTDSNAEVKAGQFSVSANGTLAYVPGGINAPLKQSMEWVTQDGAVAQVDLPLGQYFGVRISPDGRRVALASVRPGFRKSDIQLFDVDRPVFRRLTTDASNAWPVWLDNHTILFQRNTGQGAYIAELDVDGNQAPARFTAAGYGDAALVASASGGALALLVGNDVLSVPLADRDADPTPVVRSVARIMHPALSPDGRRLAYSSAETGQLEVYVVSFPSGAAKQRVSSQGGQSPTWSRDGRELYYLRRPTAGQTEVIAVPAAGASFGAPHVLFTTSAFAASDPLSSYDIAPDGRFLMAQAPENVEPPVTRIELVFDWTTELKRRIDAVGR